MPEQPSVITTFDDFSGGDYGTLGGERAPKNTFSAENMLVYADGYVGPRPGLKNITPASMPNGKLLALVPTPVVGRDGMFIIGNTVYRFDMGTPATAPTAMGTIDVTPTVALRPYLITDVFYMAVPGDKTYHLDPTNDSVADIVGSPSGTDCVIWNDQLVVVSDDNTNRLLASIPGDVNDWSEGRFIDIGDRWEITGVRSMRNYLGILKRNGAFILAGVIGDPETESIRQMSSSTTTLHPWCAETDSDDKYWFIPVFRDNPAVYDAAQLRQLPRYEFSGEVSTAATLPLGQSLAMLIGDQTPSSLALTRGESVRESIVQHNGIWTRHHFETAVSGMTVGNGDALILTDGGDTSAPAQIYSTYFNLDRPGFVSDSLVAPGDGSATPLDASITLPQWWSPAGREVQVSQVVVDFKSWNTGTAETNHFDVSVKVMGRTRADEVTYTHSTGFDEIVAESSVSGTRRRMEFNMLCSPGAGFEITLSDIRGCAIRSVTVLSPKRDERPAV